MAPNIELPGWSDFLFRPKRHKGAQGGRASGKSWTFARALCLLAVNPAPLFPWLTSFRTLCAREQQNSIKESVHHLLDEQIGLLGLSSYFKVQDNVITSTNGSEFIFSGIKQNITKIKSMEAVQICWVEEAEKVSKRSIQILIPTIRNKGSEIWWTWNPDEESDPINQRFLVDTPDNAIIRRVNYTENPWFSQDMRDEMEYDFKVDPETAEHTWNGKYRKKSIASIFGDKYVVEHFEPVTGRDFDEENWSGPYYGADWGFSTDPTTLVKCWIWKRDLYIEAESYGVGIENDNIGPKWKREIPECEKDEIRADNSRPETINHVRKKAHLRVEGCEKWPGSVEDGIAFIRSFERVVIKPDCKHAQFEAREYKYKIDKLTGLPTRDIDDKHNHIWDAVRYALDRIIKRKKSIYDAL